LNTIIHLNLGLPRFLLPPGSPRNTVLTFHSHHMASALQSSYFYGCDRVSTSI
jgi:hypothetical protein